MGKENPSECVFVRTLDRKHLHIGNLCKYDVLNEVL